MILFIDSSGFEKLHFALVDKSGKAKEKEYRISNNDTEKTLVYLSKFLGKNRLDQKNGSVDRIIVVSGPGSFSGIRTGIAISLAFGLAKGIDVYAIKKDQVPKKISDLLNVKKNILKKITESFEPDYGAEPNITTPASA